MLGLIFLAWFIPLVLLMLWITTKVYRHFKRIWLKITMSALTLILFFGVLFGDSIIGNYYLEHLCKTQGGPHIYQTVELGPEYWNEDGSAKFIYPKISKDYGRLNELLNMKYIKNRGSKTINKKIFKIRMLSTSFKLINENKVLGEHIRFSFRGGWIVNSIGHSVSSNNCSYDKNYHSKLINKIFIK